MQRIKDENYNLIMQRTQICTYRVKQKLQCSFSKRNITVMYM